MKNPVCLIFAVICSTLSAYAQQAPLPEVVKNLVTDYYSFADTSEWKKHVAVTHPKLRTDSLLREFIVDARVYRSQTSFSRIGISNVEIVADEIQYNNFLISKWKVEGYEEIELTSDQLINRKASIDSINLKYRNGYSINYKYYSLKAGTENILQCFTNWHVIIYRYAAEKNHYVIPYETRPTSPYTSVFPYEKNKLKLALRVLPMDALIQLEHVEGLQCDTSNIPLEKMDILILEALNKGGFEELLCKIGINYRTVKDIRDYQKRTPQAKFETIVSMHETQLKLFKILQNKFKDEKKYKNSYECSEYQKKQQSNGEFCSLTMRFKIEGKSKTADFIFAHSPVGWVLVDINGNF